MQALRNTETLYMLLSISKSQETTVSLINAMWCGFVCRVLENIINLTSGRQLLNQFLPFTFYYIGLLVKIKYGDKS